MNYRKILYSISATLVILSVVSLAVFRLPLGIEFNGGAIMELAFVAEEGESPDVPPREEADEALSEFDIGDIRIQESGEDSLILRFNEVSEETHQNMLSAIEGITDSQVREERFQSVGPVIGEETIEKSLQAMVLVLIVIVAYVAWAFRKVSYPLGSTRYGLIALVTLFHDILITLGVFALYVALTGSEVGVPFVAALLTILGYSVNDTIVIFDRVRENIVKFGREHDFTEIVSRSVRESFVRSINTSLTTIIVLLAIFFWGGVTLQNFVFALLIGIFIGTYSSIAFATPLLVSWVKRKGA